MGTAWKAASNYPWLNPSYLGGIDNVKTLMALRIYGNKWHVYGGLAILNPSAQLQVKQYAQSVSDLFKLMIQEKAQELQSRIKAAAEFVFGKNFEMLEDPSSLLLSDSVLNQFSLSAIPKSQRKPVRPISVLSFF